MTPSGIEPALLARIFEPLFSTKAEGAGTGLGLSTVQSVVAGAGGDVAVASEPGRGTTFTIRLPADTEGPAAGAAAAPGEPGRHATGVGTLLVCEDLPAVRRLLERILAGAGYEVLVAETPSDAIALAANAATRIDALLTDVMMPAMSGPALARELVATRPGLRVLFISGYAGQYDGDALIEGSMLLRKPFESHELIAAVQALLRSRAAADPAP